jgi:predicted PurR-regulated permease PerM
MSQQKVDQKKLDKTNRRSLVRRKKIEEALSIACVCVIAVAIVVWIGFSIFTKVQQSAEANATYDYYEISTSAIQDYLSTLN